MGQFTAVERLKSGFEKVSPKIVRFSISSRSATARVDSY